MKLCRIASMVVVGLIDVGLARPPTHQDEARDNPRQASGVRIARVESVRGTAYGSTAGTCGAAGEIPICYGDRYDDLCVQTVVGVPECDQVWCGTSREDNCELWWRTDNECDCGCQFWDEACPNGGQECPGPGRAYVCGELDRPGCGSLNPECGWSERVGQQYIFCSDYTAGTCNGRVCVNLRVADNPDDPGVWWRFEQRCCSNSDCDDSNPCTNDSCSGGSCQHSNNSNLCNDGNGCTVNDRCSGGSCSGNPRNCDDSNPCTNDSCSGGSCQHSNNSNSCNDGNGCTVNDRCSGGSCSGTPRNCDDSNPCTNDSCSGGSCQYSNNSNSCNDGNGCTVNDRCSGGSCSGTPRDCDDNNPCTNDWCSGGSCQHSNNSNSCNDSDGCTVNDQCSEGSCSGTPRDCDDDVGCTDDICDPVNDCQFTPNNDNCDDDVGCTDDICDLVNDCQFTPNNDNCDDDVGCTDDTCDLVNDCQFTPNNDNCDDSMWCNGLETCDLLDDCQPGDPRCIDAHCDEARDKCVCLADAECDDKLDCTTDTCDDSGWCEHDLNAGWCLIADTCHEHGDPNTLNACEKCDAFADPNGWTHLPSSTACDSDGNLCTGDHCDGAGQCVPYAPDDVVCQDPNPLCEGGEACDPATGMCDPLPDPELGTPCDDGVYCNGADTCDGGGTCNHTGDPCPGPDGDGDCSESCDETSDSCTADDPDGSGCGDSLYCNGTDTCSGGTCSAHAGNPCPGPDGDGNCAESCDEASNSCTANDPGGSPCDDILYCNGTDTCSGGTCSAHAGNPCPGPDGDDDCTESCDEVLNNCEGADPDESECDDVLYCNGTDTCSGGTCSVHAGDPCPGPDGDVNCGESCNETLDNCTADDPDGSGCDDRKFCTTDESCSDGACVSQDSPCSEDEICDEQTDRCVECLSDSDCDDGDDCTADRCDDYGVCVHILYPWSWCCENDADDDGVCDDRDDCPDTPAGAPVEDDGCRYFVVTIINTEAGDEPPRELREKEGQVSIPAPDAAVAYRFDHWQGGVPPGQEYDNPLDFLLYSDTTLTAHYARICDGRLCGAGCGCTPDAPALGLIFFGLFALKFIGPRRHYAKSRRLQ